MFRKKLNLVIYFKSILSGKSREKTKSTTWASAGRITKINSSEVAKLISFPTPTLHSVVWKPKKGGGTLVFQSVRFTGSNIEV